MIREYNKYKNSNVDWLGQVPEHWEVENSKWLFALRNEKARKDDEMLTASQKYGMISQKKFMELENQNVMQVIKNAGILKHIEAGDFVISMRSFQGGLEYSSLSGSVSSAYVALVPNEKIFHEFYKYLFKSPLFIQALQSTSNLVRDGQALRYNNFIQIRLPLPPIDEQEYIAKFLRKEIARIDALTIEKENFIKLLSEKRQALISHVVTKGLDDKVEVKDSGVEWIGSIPTHWNVIPLKYLCDLQTGDKDTQNAVEEGKYDLFVRAQKALKIDVFTHDCEAVLTAGDGAGVGKVFFYTNGKFSFHQRVYMMNNFKKIRGKYFYLYLSSLFASVALDGAAKSTVDSLRMPVFRNFMFTIPPEHEQQLILDYLTKECSKIDLLIEETSKSVELLKEHRSALISAAVTGKIDVRDEV